MVEDMVQHFEKYAYLLACREKIDSNLLSVQNMKLQEAAG